MAWLQITWGKMAVSDSGGYGTPLAFLHGSGCDSSDWDSVVALLPDHPRVIRLDFRGHGASDAPSENFRIEDLSTDVQATLDHFGINDVILIGHSLGGMVALDLASRSSHVKALVLLEAWSKLESASAFVEPRFYGGMDRTTIQQIQTKDKTIRSRFPPGVLNHFWTTMQEFDATAYLLSTQVPVYEIYGSMGRTESTRNLLAIPEKQNVEVIWIEGAGHYLPQEKPSAVATVCCRIMNSNRVH